MRYNMVECIKESPTMLSMAKEKKTKAKVKKYKNVGLPLSIWEELKEVGDASERSVNWMARRAVREFLDRRKQQEPPSSPPRL